jgi:hypothetical protein
MTIHKALIVFVLVEGSGRGSRVPNSYIDIFEYLLVAFSR